MGESEGNMGQLISVTLYRVEDVFDMLVKGIDFVEEGEAGHVYCKRLPNGGLIKYFDDNVVNSGGFGEQFSNIFEHLLQNPSEVITDSNVAEVRISALRADGKKVWPIGNEKKQCLAIYQEDGQFIGISIPAEMFREKS
jgi:hypothetical protein